MDRNEQLDIVQGFLLNQLSPLCLGYLPSLPAVWEGNAETLPSYCKKNLPCPGQNEDRVVDSGCKELIFVKYDLTMQKTKDILISCIVFVFFFF